MMYIFLYYLEQDKSAVYFKLFYTDFEPIFIFSHCLFCKHADVKRSTKFYIHYRCWQELVTRVHVPCNSSKKWWILCMFWKMYFRSHFYWSELFSKVFQPNMSNEEVKLQPKPLINLDKVFTEIGEFGKFQILNYICLCLAFIFVISSSLSYIFITNDLEYR